MRIRIPLGRIAIILSSFAVAWMVYELLRGAPSHRIMSPGTPEQVIIFGPGRGFIAFYVSLVAALLVPPMAITALLLSPEKPGESHLRISRVARGLYLSIGLLGLITAGGVAGYAFEAASTELRLSRAVIDYHAGSEWGRMPVHDVRAMALHSRSRTFELALAGPSEVLKIDLGAFAPSDQKMIVYGLQQLADLRRVPARSSDFVVWKRTERLSPPEH